MKHKAQGAVAKLKEQYVDKKKNEMVKDAEATIKAEAEPTVELPSSVYAFVETSDKKSFLVKLAFDFESNTAIIEGAAEYRHDVAAKGFEYNQNSLKLIYDKFQGRKK